MGGRRLQISRSGHARASQARPEAPGGLERTPIGATGGEAPATKGNAASQPPHGASGTGATAPGQVAVVRFCRALTTASRLTGFSQRGTLA